MVADVWYAHGCGAQRLRAATSTPVPLLSGVTACPPHVTARSPHVSASSPGGAAVAEPDTAEGSTGTDRPWMTIVWDDPVNLMRYVTFVFMKVFGYSEARANELMMQVHSEGKAVVSTGDRDKMESDVRKLHAAGLWATMQRDS